MTGDGRVNNQSLSILELRQRATGRFVTVVCVHLKAKAKFEGERRAQSEAILASVKLHCSKHAGQKCVIPFLMIEKQKEINYITYCIG